MTDSDLLTEIVKPLEQELGLREGFFIELQAQDDWAFIIQGHAFLEAVFSMVLTEKLGEDALEGVVAQLDMNDTRVGKVALASALRLISSAERRFLRWFSELRNDVVHDVTQTKFGFGEYIRSLDKNQRRAFVKAVSLSTNALDDSSAVQTFDPQKYALESPKEAVWAVIMVVSGRLFFGPKFPFVFVLLVILDAWIKRVSAQDLEF